MIRTLANIAGFLTVLAATLILMQRFGMIDVADGNARVIDGDSLRLGEAEVRLHGIDAPEYHQTCRDADAREYACGRDAAAALRAILKGREVNCRSVETDRYGRAVSTCRAGKDDIAAEMVRQGWAVAYTRHALSYLSEEADARRAKRGIWAGRFERPDAYRERTRQVQGDLAGVAGDD